MGRACKKCNDMNCENAGTNRKPKKDCFREPDNWRCCGGIRILIDENCPVCGDSY